MIDCPHCDRDFGEPNDAYNHIKAKHGAKNARSFRSKHIEQIVTREPSEGERLIAAIVAASCGEDVDEVTALMFPDEVAEARGQ